MLKKPLLCVALLALSPLARAEDVTATETDAPWSWKDIVISPFFNIPLLDLSIERKGNKDDDDKDDRAMKYEPSISPDVGMQVELGPVGFAFSQRIPDSTEDRAVRGRTRSSDYKFDLFRDQFGAELGFHSYRGFHRELGDDDASGVTALNVNQEENGGDSYEKREGLRKDGRYANLFWLPLGDDLHYGRSVAEGLPNGFAWSPVVQLGYDWTRIDTGDVTQPLAPADVYGKEAAVHQAEFESYIASAGAAGRVGYKGWQSTGMFLWGRSRMNQERMGGRFGFRLGTEYMVSRWVTGFSMMFDKTTLPVGPSTIESTVGGILLSFGTRLGGPRVMAH